MTEEWRVRAASLAQAAQQASTEGELGLATTRVQEALAIIEAEGSPRDLVFGTVLLVAADLSLATGELETAEPLYDRVAWVCDELDPAGTNEGQLGAVRARAFLGMARADAGREEHVRARRRYEQCLEVLASLSEPTLPAVTAAIRAELAELS